MAKKQAPGATDPAPIFSIGVRVEIINFGVGQVTELRGALGPDGAQVYRVVYRRKPKVGYIEALGSQLKPAKIGKRSVPADAT